MRLSCARGIFHASADGSGLRWMRLLVLSFILLSPVRGFTQETETGSLAGDVSPPERNIWADIGYTALGVIKSNVVVNYANRLAGASFAMMTFESTWNNIVSPTWIWENGDRFLVNQFLHPWHGSTYFAAARANGFNFFESMPVAALGSLMWEVMLEPKPAWNDLIVTTLGGIAYGEIMHRLFMELGPMTSIWRAIGGFFVSPLSSYNLLFNRPNREVGGGNIERLSFRTGIEQSFAFFPGHRGEQDSWRYPGAALAVNVVYGDPFSQDFRRPFDHFEFFASFSTNTHSYHMIIVSDGYIFAFNPWWSPRGATSMGLSLHFDYFGATNDLIDNFGYGNIQFSSSAVGWTVKHMRRFAQRSRFELRAHANAILWGATMYNANYGDPAPPNAFWLEDIMGTNRGSFGMGPNVKLGLALDHERAGRLDLHVNAYHIAVLPVTRYHLRGNVFFVHAMFNYELPLTPRLGVGATGTMWGLFGFHDSMPDVNRILVSNFLYLAFRF